MFNRVVLWLGNVSTLLLRRAYLVVLIVVVNVVLMALIAIHIAYPFNVVFVVVSITGSTVFIVYYTGVKRLGGIVPVSDDLVFILVHMRCLATANPPVATLFKKVGEAEFYRKKYREMCYKVFTLTKNWGYGLPDSLRLVAREAPSKIEEQLLQRFSAIVATGADIREYLRLEYNTLFSEYKSAYGRMIDMLRVVLGIYTTLVGALTFLISTLLLLGIIFGGAVHLVLMSIIGMSIALLTMAVLMYFIIRRPLFECKRPISPLIKIVSILGTSGLAFLVASFTYLTITYTIGTLEVSSLCIVLTGLVLLPAGLLVKVHESRIMEYDMFYPAFIRSYGEHLAVVPNMIESLKPLLVAELGKLKKLLIKVYAGLVNRIDPRLIWRRFSLESGSELIVRASSIFMDTIELGGNIDESGVLLSDHLNELYRLRLAYMQVFKTFEVTLYVMHTIAIILLIFIGGFMSLFSEVILKYALTIPPEFAGIFAFFTIAPMDVSFLVNVSALILALSNTIALISVNPGSKYAIYYYLSIMLVLTGGGLYLGYITINQLLGVFLIPFI